MAVKLYIKQKLFSLGDKYQVFNEFGQPYFEVQGEIFTFGAKIHLLDLQGNELFYIQQRLLQFLPRYEIYAANTLCAVVQKKFSFLRSRMAIESAYGNFELEGSFWEHDYTIYCNGNLLGSVQKEWMTWADTYCLTIPNNKDAAFFAALVITMDHCDHNNND